MATIKKRSRKIDLENTAWYEAVLWVLEKKGRIEDLEIVGCNYKTMSSIKSVLRKAIDRSIPLEDGPKHVRSKMQVSNEADAAELRLSLKDSNGLPKSVLQLRREITEAKAEKSGKRTAKKSLFEVKSLAEFPDSYVVEGAISRMLNNPVECALPYEGQLHAIIRILNRLKPA